jgi:hypothetical protein
MTALLAAQEFQVSIVDRQVIFDSTHDIWSTHTRFALERPPMVSDGHTTGGTWQFVALEATSGKIAMSTLLAALWWVNARFGGDFESYKNEMVIR